MIISDSSPIILLCKINKMDLLKTLYGKVFIPEAVYKEIVVDGKAERYGDAFIIEKIIDDIIFVKPLGKTYEHKAQNLKSSLGAGESESIALCMQEKSKMLLIDDWKSR